MLRGNRRGGQTGRLPGQTTFAAVPSASALRGNSGQPLPPMTSKEAQRRHRQAIRQPRRPREVERAFERAEQARIRRELREQEEAAREREKREHRLQRARQKKQAQEVKQRETSGQLLKPVETGQRRLTSFFPRTYHHIIERYRLSPLLGEQEGRREADRLQDGTQGQVGVPRPRVEGKQDVIVID